MGGFYTQTKIDSILCLFHHAVWHFATHGAACLALTVFLFHQTPLKFGPHPFETPVAVLAFNPPLEGHKGVVLAQPSS